MSLLSIGLFITYFNCIFSACPPGWIAGTSSSSCYQINQKHLNWRTASHACNLIGAHLARVESEDEMKLIKNETELLPGQYWLDGVDDVVEGDWRWASTSKRIEHDFWCPGEPNQNSRSENCMETASRYQGRWNDEDCSVNQYSICEKEIVLY